MIKFFRHIRQKLLSKNMPDRQADKFSKYLLYAIGEIILVVIGIMIALQANNWNEKLKTNNTIETIIDKVEDDVIADIKYVNNEIALWREIEPICHSCEGRNP